MTLIDSGHRPVQIPYDRYILVALDSLFLAKTMKAHDTVLRWQEWFWQIQMPVVILSNDPSYTVHHSYIHYIYCVDQSFYREYHLLQNKKVFGKERKVITASVFVFVNGKVVKKLARVNDHSIAEIYLFVLKMWVQNQVKKVKKKIDKERTL